MDAVEPDLGDTVAHVRDGLVDERQFADTKSNCKYGFLMGLETAQDVAFSVIRPSINTGGIEAIDDYYRTLDALTPEDVREAASRFLVDERASRS